MRASCTSCLSGHEKSKTPLPPYEGSPVNDPSVSSLKRPRLSPSRDRKNFALAQLGPGFSKQPNLLLPRRAASCRAVHPFRPRCLEESQSEIATNSQSVRNGDQDAAAGGGLEGASAAWPMGASCRGWVLIIILSATTQSRCLGPAAAISPYWPNLTYLRRRVHSSVGSRG